MLTILYISGGLCAVVFLYLICFKDNKRSISENVILYSIAIIPLGKLIYLPIPGYMGLKFTFLVAAISSSIWVVTEKLNYRALILLTLLCVPVFSITWLDNPDWLISYAYIEKAGFDAGFETGTKESVLLRLIAFAILVFYCISIVTAMIRNHELIVVASRYFVLGTIVASAIGFFIFLGVFNNLFSVEDLLPISVDVHIIEGEKNFYRFNPGSNVNEFSMIIAFAILLLLFVSWPNKYIFLILSFFLVCEVATLTRGSWVALILGLSAGVLALGNYKKFVYRIFITFTVVFLGLLFLYYFSGEFSKLMDTRLSFEIGISGVERLEKFSHVISSVGENPFRLLFGYGWSSNLYVHNVFLQLLYEVGVIGLVVFFITIWLFLSGLFSLRPGIHKFFSYAVVTFIGVSSLVHHTLYHLQTWFMLAIVFVVISIAKGKNENASC